MNCINLLDKAKIIWCVYVYISVLKYTLIGFLSGDDTGW